MNITEYIYLINRPDAVHDKQTEVLEKIVQEFPYFQSARALYLKGLYNQNSFKYNYALKIAAAHTCDRGVLFDFITSDTFKAIDKELLDQRLSEIADISVREGEIVEPETGKEVQLGLRENTVEQSILSSISKSAPENEIAPEPFKTEILAPQVIEETEPVTAETAEITAEVTPEPVIETAAEPVLEKEQAEPTATHVPEIPNTHLPNEPLELGQPLQFDKNERHSFQEWLQLSKFEPIDRGSEPQNPAPDRQQHEMTDANAAADHTDIESEKQKKKELIDRFIQTSPKIPPVRPDAGLSPSIIVEPSRPDNSYLMTETLARVYLEQKKFSKAIQAYEILILKYPEKSSFFADRILDIKNLQQKS